MDISPRKSLKQPSEPVDEWLHNEGYFRKHIPRHPTCLFRAIAEQIYSTQYYHIRVRCECVDFMRKNRHLFEQFVSIPYENYLEQMSCITEWGGLNEIRAMSMLYERDIVVFDAEKMITQRATENGYKESIYLCCTPRKQYESVYAREFIAKAAYCQSLVYQTLYKDVFKMPNIDETVQKMLHDRPENFRHDKFFLKGNLEKREKLTTELLSKIEKGHTKDDEEKSIARGIAPFPYRVAKALDPNIYRNTDFDIWHEIRREVRNSGWTKWNTTELQVGGRCLVQLDYKESADLDKTNNNFPQSSLDNNGNASSDTSITKNTRVSTRRPTLLYGYIQEMSKNDGPVVVFIEELGEKRILPYAALKPIAPKRGKQSNNWSVNNCRRNSTYDTRTWNSNNRKSKETILSYGTKNPVDRNNNSSSGNEHKTDGKVKDNEKVECWDDETSDQKKNTGTKNYTMETYNSCQGFTVESTIDVRPVTVLLDNAQPRMRPSSLPPNMEDYTKNPPQTAKILATSNDNPERGSPNIGVAASDSVAKPPQQGSFVPSPETFYPAGAGIPPIFPLNQNTMCSPDSNSYLLPFPFFPGEPPVPGSVLGRTICAINFSAPASVEANGSDLPFSDTVTLRFFYNLGLEYFRAGFRAWGYGTDGQPMNLSPIFFPPGNFLTGNPPIDHNPQQASIINEDENSRSTRGPRQNYGSARRYGDNSANMGKNNNSQQQHQLSKTFNNRKSDMQQDHSHGQSNNETITKLTGDFHRQQSYINNRMKEHPGGRKNGPPSRYKKNMEGRNRNSLPPNVYSHEQPMAMYQTNNTVSSESSSFETTKDSSHSANLTHLQHQPPGQQSSPPGGNQSTNYQSPYGQQAFYTPMPYYPSDGETFFAPPGFYPIPCVTHPDMVDGNSAIPSAHVYPPTTENYGQPISAIYPPYVYPPQAIYPGLPPPPPLSQQQQNGQDNWYPMPGQAQYVQYPQIQTPPNPNSGSPPWQS